MTTMIAEVYDALREAGASEEKARRAAEALAGHEDPFARIEHRITELRGDFAAFQGEMRGRLRALEARLSGVEARLTTMQWAIGLLAAMQIAVLVKLFVHG